MEQISSSEKIDLVIGKATVPSEKHPEYNEDRVWENPAAQAVGICDGMGGRAGAERAASIVADALASNFDVRGESIEEKDQAIEKIVRDANELILAEAQKNPELCKMATTLAFLVFDVAEGKPIAFVGNVGDSRVYLKKSSAPIQAVTLDHSNDWLFNRDTKKAWELQKKLSEVTKASQLRGDDRYSFEERNILGQVMGRSLKEVSVYVISDFSEGDTFVLSSDGIHDNLTDNELNNILSNDEQPQRLAELITEAATKKSKSRSIRAKKDDMSVIVVRVGRFG